MANEATKFTISGVQHDVMDVGARQLIANVQAAINAITSGDTTTAIKTFQEVINFLDGVTDNETLAGKLNELRTLINGKVSSSDLAEVATSGSYNDLKNKPTIPDVSNLATKQELSSKANIDDVYNKTDVDEKVANAGKVKSVTINGTKKLPNEQTGDVDLGNISGAQGPQGNSGVASADGVIVVNNLTEGGTDVEVDGVTKVKVLSAEMGKELNLDVNGKENTKGTWKAGGYQFNGAVGDTFAGTVTTAYPYEQSYKYCRLEVATGDKIHVKAQHNGSYYTVVIVDSSGTVLQLGSKNAVDNDFDITADGFVYITNKTSNGTPSAMIYDAVDGHEQRINALDERVSNLEDEVAEIKETTDPALIDAQINGRDIRATFYNNAYYNSGSAAVGSTFNPSRSSYTGYKCAKQEVREGDKVIVVAKGSEYQYPVIITDSSNVVTALEPKNTFVNKTITIEQDGYIYVNNVDINYTTPICHIYNASAKQMAESVMATLPESSFVEGQSAYLPLTRGHNPYPNTNEYFMNLDNGTNSNASTPWMAMPHGTYILRTTGAYVFQADKPLFQNDYARNGVNIWEKSFPNGGMVEITHDYVMIKFTSVSTDADLATYAPIYCDNVTSVAVKSSRVAHVAHKVNGNFNLYLPLRDKYYCFVLTHYQSPYLEHFGISDVYMCDDAGYVYQQTRVTRDSEYECAINVQGQDYLGGHMHGHEQIVTADTTIYINGQSKTVDEAFGEDVTGMFELMTHTILYQTDNTTKVADVYKRWRVVDGKLHLYNRVVFAGSYHINRAQFSMFGIYRHIGGTDKTTQYLTCWASRNSDTRVYKTTDGWDTSSPTDGSSVISAPAKATLQEQWGEVGYIVRQEIFENNQKENGGMFINTNGGGEYNKMYFEIGSNFDVADGDELFSHSVLSIE